MSHFRPISPGLVGVVWNVVIPTWFVVRGLEFRVFEKVFQPQNLAQLFTENNGPVSKKKTGLKPGFSQKNWFKTGFQKILVFFSKKTRFKTGFQTKIKTK